MKEIVFDVEANGLLDKISKVWVIAATNVEGTKQWIFTDQDDTGDYKKQVHLKTV